MVLPVNATGWSNFINGNLVEAAYDLYDNAFFGYHLAIPILFILMQFMLYIKTRNVVLTWIIGVFTGVLYLTSIFVDPLARSILMGILIVEMTGILYYLIFK
jgi:hypothetical protein